MNKICKIIGLKTMKLYMIFGREKYIKHLVKYYKKNGVVFSDGDPLFIAADAYLDTSSTIYIGKNCTIASKTTILTHDYSIAYANMFVNKVEGFPMLKKV